VSAEAALPDLYQISQHDLQTNEYDEILALWERAGLPVRPDGRDAPDTFARQMVDPRQRVVGLRADGKLVAVVVLTHDGRKGWINRLAVDPAFRRRGLAARLVAEAERWFVEDQGLEIWAALIEGENQDSQALFAALNYRRHDVVYVSKRTRPGA
jgi:ribosomal protein S18 acetylase RimI-like enzyme